MIEDSMVDYILRCIKGIFRGRFIYLNLTEDGKNLVFKLVFKVKLLEVALMKM